MGKRVHITRLWGVFGQRDVRWNTLIQFNMQKESNGGAAENKQNTHVWVCQGHVRQMLTSVSINTLIHLKSRLYFCISFRKM